MPGATCVRTGVFHNAACRRAIDVGDPSYKTVKGILAAGTEHDGDDAPAAPPSAPAHRPGVLFGSEVAG